MTLNEEVERGRLASEVLENPVYQAAWAQIRGEIVERWEGEKDERSRQWLWDLMQATKRLESVFRESMNAGKLAAAELQRKQTLLERAGNLPRRLLR